MNKQFVHTLLHRCGVGAGDHITVALSGGRDSVVLTHLLRQSAETLGITLSALHIHHGLRAASDGEEQFVRSLCQQWQIPLTVRHLHLAEQDHKGASLEMAAREARYAVFAEFCSHHGYVATAHHLDDNMATFFINLCRGSGSKGLCGIPYTRDGILRPLLDIAAEDIAAYAQSHHLTWVEDESNTDPYYLRNFMRKEIIPRLKSRGDVSFGAGFAATLANLREESAYLDSLAHAAKAQKTADLPKPLAWRVLKEQCPALTRERFARIYDRLQNENSFSEQIAGEQFAFVKAGQVTFGNHRRSQPLTPCPLQKQTRLSDGRTIYLEEIHSEFTNYDMDCDKIGHNLYVRSRQSGDTVTLVRRPTKTLKKLFCEHKVADREHRAVITDGDVVLWVEGFGADRRCAPDIRTKRAYRIKWIK